MTTLLEQARATAQLRRDPAPPRRTPAEPGMYPTPARNTLLIARARHAGRTA
ncbi:hypothetical protein [Streptomyces sp. NPDC126503]|uniref:hypothetical protein n=1 Tax=Streptomyces sp. NPDC126503 TaxID=3155315 RepID=UPI00333203E0